MKIALKKSVVLRDGSVYNLAIPYLLNENSILWDEMINWCVCTFGPEGDLDRATLDTWYYSGGGFCFRDEANLTMFVLRWS